MVEPVLLKGFNHAKVSEFEIKDETFIRCLEQNKSQALLFDQVHKNEMVPNITEQGQCSVLFIFICCYGDNIIQQHGGQEINDFL